MNTFLNLESDKNSQFEIKIENIEHKLSIKAKNMTVIPNKNYYKSMSLEEIKVNKFFSFCDDIGEVINELTEIKKTKLTEETNQITLYIPINSKKIKEFVIQMKEIEKTTEEKFEELYKIINTVREENNKLRIKLEAIEDKYNKEIIILKQNNEELKEYFESITNSKILNVNQYKILKNWINPNVKMKFELIYSAKRDGDNRKAFHDRCDNKSPTIIIVKTGKNIILEDIQKLHGKAKVVQQTIQNLFAFLYLIIKDIYKIKERMIPYIVIKIMVLGSELAFLESGAVKIIFVVILVQII